jgi:16S rRNA (adenine1518-N6/adenine1519-N6)-dimethyltransferase
MQQKPKKNLGQNFLVDPNIRRKIIFACEIKPTETILEIGAGQGELTSLLVEEAKKVYAVEIDPVLSAALKKKFQGCRRVRIIEADILKLDFKKYFRRLKGKLKVVGNIPYYITTPIIARLLQYRNKINSILLTVQKEFAQRIIAPAGTKDYGAFSCFVRYHGDAGALFDIGKNCFFPKPKVDSCFLKLDIRSNPAVAVKDQRRLFRIIRTAFGQRRKTLRNSLKGIVAPQKLEDFFANYNIDNNIRPENLTLEDFAHLSNL